MPTGVMLALVALLYGVAAWPLGGDLRRLAEMRVEQDAALLEQRVQLSVARRIAELRQLARGLRGASFDDRVALRAELEELKQLSGAYAWLALTDPEGKVLVASHGWLEGQSLQGRPVYERGREGLWFGEFHPAKLLARFLAGSESGEVWVADIGAPVLDGEGRLRAVLVSHLQAEWLKRLADDTLGQERQRQLGLRWALLQADGQAIGRPGGVSLPLPPDTRNQRLVLQDVGGDDWLLAQRGFDIGVQSELRWRALVAQDLDTALAPQRRLYLWLGGLALLTLLLGGLLAHWLTRLVARPYAGLLAAAQRRAEAAGTAPADAELLGRLGDELSAVLQDPQAEPLLRHLASNAQQLRRMLDHLPMGLALCDAGQQVIYVNRGLVALLGREPAELMGRPLADALAVDVLDSPPGGQSRQGRLELPSADGAASSLAWQQLPLFDRSGRLDGSLLLLQDQSREVGERRRADALQRRFAVLVNNAHSDAFVLLDADGQVRDWSQGAVQLSGWSAEAALGRPLGQLLLEAAEADSLLARLQADGQAPLTTRWRRADGGSFVARGRAYRLPEGELALIFSDATRDEEAAQRLADSEARLAAVIAGASDAVISTDADGRVLLFNPAAERIFGVSQAEMLGQPLDRLLPPAERASHPDRLAAFAQSESSRRPMGVGKVGGLRADGEALVLEAAISAVRVGGRKLLTAILRDVTERDRAEQRLVGYQLQLTELTQRLLAQEKETTRRLAQVLHDELGQTLAALRLMLDAGLQRGDAPAWVGRLDSVLATANRQVREVLTELRPPLLDDQGLRAALLNELQQQQGRHEALSLGLDWQADTAQRWPADVEYAAFMVAREALGNALRHAQASRITLRCLGNAQRLQLSVSDDGHGDAELASRLRPGHLGLVGMRERALAIAARLDIESTPQSGTTVSICWESHEPSLPDR